MPRKTNRVVIPLNDLRELIALELKINVDSLPLLDNRIMQEKAMQQVYLAHPNAVGLSVRGPNTPDMSCVNEIHWALVDLVGRKIVDSEGAFGGSFYLHYMSNGNEVMAHATAHAVLRFLEAK